MKRAGILMLALLVTALGGLCCAFGVIERQRDQVTLTETVEYGDPSVLEGLTVQCRTHFRSHMIWDTTYTTDGDTAISETDYTFYPVALSQGISDNSWGIYADSALCTFSDAPETVLYDAYQQLLDDTPAGEEASTCVYLKDYLDYYLLSFSIELPGCRLYYMDRTSEPDENIEAFQSYFRIPVLEDEQVELTVSKPKNGSSIGIGYGLSSTESDSFSFWCYSVATDDACYFTFHNRSNEGKVMDTSLIPGGYGIYRFPYGDGKIDLQALSTVYPLGPEVEVQQLLLSADRRQLLLFTLEGDDYVLTVLDAETVEPLQRLVFAHAEGENTGILDTYLYEDFLVLSLADDRLALLDWTDGQYALRLNVALNPDADAPLYYLRSAISMDWDGQRLVLATSAVHDTSDYHADLSGFCLAVYNTGGMLCFAEYASSLDAPALTVADAENYFSYYDTCHLTVSDPLSVRWD